MQLNSNLSKHFQGDTAFEQILALQGEVFRELEGRRTIRFSLNGKYYFAKLHFGIGWKEIAKNLLQFKKPVLSAETEWRAIRRLEELGIAAPKIAGFGRKNWNPARVNSFLITEELPDTISLEDVTKNWSERPPPFALKRALIEHVAIISRQLHEHGLNHRDFYLCHFLVERAVLDPPFDPKRLRLYLIDLHRAQIRPRTPTRWIRKDLAGLLFSSFEIGLTQRDLFRFIKNYRNRSLREILGEEKYFWRAIFRQAAALYKKLRGRRPPSIQQEGTAPCRE